MVKAKTKPAEVTTAPVPTMAVIAEVSPPVRASLSLWDDLTTHYRPRDFAVRCWDGTTSDPDPGQPARLRVVIQDKTSGLAGSVRIPLN